MAAGVAAGGRAGANFFFATGLGASRGGSGAGGASGAAAGATEAGTGARVEFTTGSDGCRRSTKYDTPVAASAPVRNPRMSFWFNSDTSLYYYNAAAF